MSNAKYAADLYLMGRLHAGRDVTHLVRDLAAYIANHDQSNLPHGLLLRADEFLGEDVYRRCADRNFEDRHGRHCVAVLPDEPEEWCGSCRVTHALLNAHHAPTASQETDQ